MDPDYRRMMDFLVGLGTDSVPHSGDKGFLAHLIGVFRDLESWGCDRDVCRAGLFHSIYGTQLFQRFCLPLNRRDEVKQLIGDRAERLAFVNCVMDRSSFDQLITTSGPYRILDRLSGQAIELDDQDFHFMTCASSTCATGWNRWVAASTGTIDNRPIEIWPFGWVESRRNRLIGCTRCRSCQLEVLPPRNRVKNADRPKPQSALLMSNRPN